MSLKNVWIDLDKINKESSTNGKVELLTKALEDTIFRKVVQYAYNQGWSYNVKQVPYEKESTSNNVDAIFNFLDYLRNKGGATDQEKQRLSWLSSIDLFTSDIVTRIVNKDLRSGFSIKLVNKARKGTVEQVPYQRCSGEENLKRIIYPAIVEKKADGMFAYGFPWKEEDIFTTRYGNTFHLHGYLKQELLEILSGEQKVTVGELLVTDEHGNILDRKTGNGILNKFIHGTGTIEEAERIIYVLWDAIPLQHYENKACNISHALRFPDIRDKVDKWAKKNYPNGFSPVEVIPYQVVSNEEEAMTFYKKMREEGYEGAVLKDNSATWKHHTCPKIVKLKNKCEAEFEIVDALYGAKGKQFENMMGSLLIKTSDGGILTEVGTGFSLKERELGVDWWKKQIGKIVTVSFESVIEDKNGRNTKCLFLPAFEETRFNEKSGADTTSYCIRISTQNKGE